VEQEYPKLKPVSTNSTLHKFGRTGWLMRRVVQRVLLERITKIDNDYHRPAIDLPAEILYNLAGTSRGEPGLRFRQRARERWGVVEVLVSRGRGKT